MNSDTEKAVFAVAEAQDMLDGDLETFTLFGVAHVEQADEYWLAVDHDLDLPPTGWYMVTKSDAGAIYTFPATESVCMNWYREMQRLFQAQEARD